MKIGDDNNLNVVFGRCFRRSRSNGKACPGAGWLTVLPAGIRDRIRQKAWLLLLLFAAPAFAQEMQLGVALNGAVFYYTVQRGDSLTGIGARFGMDPLVLARTNGLAATALLKIGQVLEVDNRHIVPDGMSHGILINLPQRMLFRMADGGLQAAYPVALGRPDWPTPTGEVTVTSRVEGKTWFVPQSIQEEMLREGQEVQTQVPPGPDNPLGKHWLGLSLPGYGIHGTIAPQSIYQFRSHGCIRLHPDDAAELFGAVQEGDAGVIIYQPVLLFSSPDERVFLEVHRDIYKKGIDVYALARELADVAGVSEQIDWKKAAAVIRAHEGLARDVTRAGDKEEPWN